MSDNTNPTGDFLDGMSHDQLMTLYNGLLLQRGRPGSNAPMTMEELRQQVRNMLTNPPTPEDKHPQQLALQLGAAVTQTWEVSMTEVTRLMADWIPGRGSDLVETIGPPCNHVLACARRLALPDDSSWEECLSEVARLMTLDGAPPALPNPVAPTSDPMRGLKIPEQRDIPAFPGRAEWEEWDTAFTNYCEVYPIDMPSALVHAFISRIKNRLQENKECAFLKPLPAANFALPVGGPYLWETSWQSMRENMYAHFKPHDYVQAHQAAWENATTRLQKARHSHAADYYGDFARIIAVYELARRREPRLRAVTEQEKVTKFYDALPLTVTNRLQTIIGDVWNDATWQQRRTQVEWIWADIHHEKPHVVKRARVDSDEDDDEASLRIVTKRQKTGARCILRYINFEIPEQFKGRLRQENGEINQVLLRELRRAGRCSTCRKTKREHTMGSPFDDPTSFPTQDKAVRWADVKGEEKTPETSALPIRSEENS